MATYLTIPKFGFVSQLNRIPITPTGYPIWVSISSDQKYKLKYKLGYGWLLTSESPYFPGT